VCCLLQQLAENGAANGRCATASWARLRQLQLWEAKGVGDDTHFEGVLNASTFPISQRSHASKCEQP